jgi:acetyl-CoA synthetase
MTMWEYSVGQETVFSMSQLTEYSTYADALKNFSSEKLWQLFDGNREQFNIAHECVDRHAHSGRDAIIVVHSEGQDEIISYFDLAEASSQFAHWLTSKGIQPGHRVAVMLEPSRAYYVAIFGIIKTGAIAVPMFTLFGSDGMRLRINDCQPAMVLTNHEKADTVRSIKGVVVEVFDDAVLSSIRCFPSEYTVQTRADSLAVFQYTSGTTRELPEAVKHSQKTLITLMVAALYGTGLRPGDLFMCPSSPAWGHGLWHGTFAPLSMGLTIGAFAGRFNPQRLLQALSKYKFTNMSAAATHYRMMKNSGFAGDYSYNLEKLSFTGEPIDDETGHFIRNTFGIEVCSMYGTTEIGVVLVNYPGASDFPVKPGSLGKAVPGGEVQIQDDQGRPCPPGITGNLMVRRRGQWIHTKDLARMDQDGYFYHAGRADDVIISAGWTMSAVEIENALLLHPNVKEAAAIGIPDELRGQVVKAFIVSDRPGSDELIKEIQDLLRNKLSQHEYPRVVAFVAELPKTPAGKIHRKILRESESRQSTIN